MNINSREMFYRINRLQEQTNELSQKSIERLSTGLRINKASDDVAGLQISERLISQTRESEMKQKNIGQTMDAAKGILGFYDGTLEQLQRLRELQVQYNNGTNQLTDKKEIQSEMVQIINNIEQTRKNFSFNNQNLLESFSLNFEGVTGTKIPYGQGINPATDPHSFTMWVKSDHTSPAQKMVFSQSGTNANRIYISITYGKWSTGIQEETGGSGDPLSSGSIPNNTEWTHLALVMDGSEANLYVNGELSSTRDYTGYLTASDFSLGYISGVAGQDFVGQIDDLHIYDRALSVNEVSQDKSGTLANSLVGNWAFEDPENVMKDSSGNGLDGVNVAATSTGGSGNVIKLDSNYSFKVANIDIEALELKNFEPSNQDSLNIIDNAIDRVLKSSATVGSAYNRMEFKQQNESVKRQNTATTLQKIKETDMVDEMSKQAKYDILSNTQVTMQKQYSAMLNQRIQLLTT